MWSGALFIGLMIWGLLQKFRVQFALKNGLARMLNGRLPVNPTANPAERAAEMRRALADAMRSTETPATDRAPLSAGTILVLAAGVLSALVAIVPIQLIAYEMSVARGINPDKPRNLAKAVTVD